MKGPTGQDGPELGRKMSGDEKVEGGIGEKEARGKRIGKKYGGREAVDRVLHLFCRSTHYTVREVST